MKAKFATTLFCECNRGMEHVGNDYLKCINPACPRFGVKYAMPTLDLVEYVEPGATEAVAGDFGLEESDLAGQPLSTGEQG